MKSLTLTLIALTGLCTLAYAGPEPIPSSGKEMKEVALQPPPCHEWTGFYVGGFGAWDYAVFDPSVRDAREDEAEDAREVEKRAHDLDLNANGAEVGGLIGFNFQLHRWVFGVEIDGGYTWARNSEHDKFAIPGSDDLYVLAPSIKTHYLATFGGRVGYALGRTCRLLPYVTGGMALGDLDFEQRISETDDWSQTRSKDNTNVGWFVGGGLQYALTNHLSVRGQYEYVDLGDVNVSYHVPTEFSASSRMELRHHNVSLAIIYGF